MIHELMAAVALSSVGATWAIVGIWWLFAHKDVNDLGPEHAFMGGPFVWMLVVGVVLVLGVLWIFDLCGALDRRLTRWSLRPVERAVDEYQTQGGYHG